MEFTSEVSTNEVIIKAIVLNNGYDEPKLEDVSTLIDNADLSMAFRITPDDDKVNTAKYAMYTKLACVDNAELRLITFPNVKREQIDNDDAFSVFIRPVYLKAKGMSTGNIIMSHKIIIAIYDTKEKRYYGVDKKTYDMIKKAYIPKLRMLMVGTSYQPSTLYLIPPQGDK